ncbi:DnaT-like ssDNA-binding protein [Pantoea sp. 1.19]|uniref:DnaT-like ssDNA-binding protein n=1 Tax=Pantoea sp. 1.19 TaxID=1925589 RepID=UPI000948A809|nr:DnaT-like ssDNA-binding protein [Pantoea sp. 1.19]
MINSDPDSPDFNSYASVAVLESFADRRGREITGDIEVMLTRAMDYLEGLEWDGRRTDPYQPLAWPRSDAWFDGYPIPARKIPRQVINAQCMLALEAMNGELLGSVREAAVKSERVEGAVTTTYAVADGETFTPQYPAVFAVLGTLTAGRGFSINSFAERG